MHELAKAVQDRETFAVEVRKPSWMCILEHAGVLHGHDACKGRETLSP